jgi:hypothetical protein
LLQSVRRFRSSSISKEEFSKLIAMLQPLRMFRSYSITKKPFDKLAVLQLLRMKLFNC